MARGDSGQVIAMNPTSDGWSLGSSSSNEQGTCLRDTQVVEMVNTPMIVTGLNNSVDGGTIYRTGGYIGKCRFAKKIISLRHKCDKQAKTSSEQLDYRVWSSGEVKI